MSESGLTPSAPTDGSDSASIVDDPIAPQADARVADKPTMADAASDTMNGSASLAVSPASTQSANGEPGVPPMPPQPGVGVPAKDGEDVFARAVGLAEAPAARDRRGRRRGGTPARPEVTPEDAARIATGAQHLGTAPTFDTRAAAEPLVDPGSKNASWLQRRRLRVRRTRRTLRHIDPWSVFKVSLLLYACLYVAVTIACVILWSAAIGSGLIEKIESFIESVMQYELFEFQGDEIFSAGTKIGVVVAAGGVALNVVLAILFNLISDLVGGIRVTILEEDGVPRSTV